MPDLITVIMPSLNVCGYIKKCMDSVLGQTFKHLEILCIDAGSTDGTQEIIESYTKIDNRVRLVRSDKKSYGYQVNLGISMAQGKYVGIVETDDYIRNDMYQTLYDAIEGTNYDFVKADYDSFFIMRGEPIFRRVRTFAEGPDKYNRTVDSCELTEVYNVDNVLWKGLYRRSFLEEEHIRLNESPGAAYQDVGFLIQVFDRAKEALYLDKSLYCYRLDRGGASMVSPNCFAYIKNEIEWILQENILDRCDEKHRKAALERIVNVFLEQYGNALDRHHYNWRDPSLAETHRWFENYMDDYLEKYHTELREMNQQVWKQYRLAMDSPDQFAEETKNKYYPMRNIIEQIKKQDEFILFGGGGRGYQMLRKCTECGTYPIAIADNNAALWGTSKGCIPVMSPAECFREYSSAAYVIANKNSCDKIFEQLVAEGVPEDKIIVN